MKLFMRDNGASTCGGHCSQEASGGVWRRLEASGGVWRRLEASAVKHNPGRYLESVAKESKWGFVRSVLS